MKTTTKAAPKKTATKKAAGKSIITAAIDAGINAKPKSKKKSGAQRRREAREREAQLAARNGDLSPEAFDRLGGELDAMPTITATHASPASILDVILDAMPVSTRKRDDNVVVAPAAPAIGPNGVPTLDGILDAKKAADEKKAAKQAKRAPKPKKDAKSYHTALSSLSRMNQRDLTWRAGDMVKRAKFATFELALASVLVNMSATVIDKYDGGTGGPIVNAPSVATFVAGLDAETVATVKRTTAARTPRAAKVAATANELAIMFAGQMVEDIGAKRAAKRLAGMLAKARTDKPDQVAYLEAAVAEADRLATLAK